MTEEQWKVFAPLYKEFRETLSKAATVLYSEDLDYHTPEINLAEDLLDGVEPYTEFFTEYYDRCDGTSYTCVTISNKTFIENTLDKELERLNKEREAARLKKIEDDKIAEAKYQAEREANKYRQYLALKKEFENNE